MTDRFEGKRVVITGATSGIGLAGARRTVAEGGVVVATGRDETRLSSLRAALPESCVVLADDASDLHTGERLCEAVEKVGQIDGLWLNAGYAAVCDMEAVDPDIFDQMMAANVRGPMLQMAALSPLLNDGASVVVTSSTSAYEGSPMASVYAATKGALLSLSRCWANALGPRGIRVNALVPGPIDTEFRSFMAEDLRAEFENEVTSGLALPRIGTADQAAAVALFLLSGDAGFVTGAQYAVDGGLVMQ